MIFVLGLESIIKSSISDGDDGDDGCFALYLCHANAEHKIAALFLDVFLLKKRMKMR